MCSKCGIFEVEHSMNDDAYTLCSQVRDRLIELNGLEKMAEKEIKASGISLPKKDCKCNVTRDITGGNGFVLEGDGWYKDGYGNKKSSSDDKE